MSIVASGLEPDHPSGSRPSGRVAAVRRLAATLSDLDRWLGHTEWLFTSPSSEPFTGSMATDTTDGLAGSLMSSRTRPASQLAR